MKKNKKKLFAVLLCVLILSSSVVVQAYTESSWLIFPSVEGVTYKGKTSTHGNGSAMWANATTMASKGVAGGRMGSLARLYLNGSLVKSTGVIYNDGGAQSIIASTPTNSTRGNYKAGGTSYIYNPSTGSYSAHTLINSPAQTFSDSEVEIIRNENGEIYGSEYELLLYGIQPDLVSAIGVDGTEGYVKEADINAVPQTLEEALEYTPTAYEVPLYEEDGETVIGTFIVDVPTEAE